MNETVGMCKNNIDDVLTKIRSTCDALTTAEKATAGLKSKDMISKNTAQFALWIEKGQQILDRNSLAGCKDRDVVTHDLQAALQDSASITLPYIQSKISKLKDGSEINPKVFQVLLRAVERSMKTE